MTAAITWAVLATVGAVAVYWLMRREVRYWRQRFSDADVAVGTWEMKAQAAGLDLSQFKQAYTFASRAHDEIVVDLNAANARANEAEDRLHQIDEARHLSAKHARAAQLAAKRLQVVGKAAEINREMGR